jgi:integrase
MLMKTDTKERDHLTDAKVRALVAPAGRHNKVFYDDTGFGFGVRVTHGGAKSFILNYWTKSGRERRITIGRFPTWGTAAARERARELRREIDCGADPMAEIRAQREAPTVGDLCDRFEQEHLPKKSERTAEDYRGLIRLYIRPALGNLKVSEVGFADIERLHNRITAQGSPYQANRAVMMASKMFSLARLWHMRETNPCQGIQRNREDSRRRYATNEELERLMAALAEDKNQQACNIIRICLLTGCRRGEALAMRWKDIDLTDGLWTKPPSGTKQRRHHQSPLSPPARQLLSGIAEKYQREHPGQPLPVYVFPGRGGSGHATELKEDWKRLCAAAKVSDLRVHDLRHTFASQLASSGASLALIGSLLGHSSPATTHRYAHLFPDAEREAVARVGAILVNAGKPVKEPVKLQRRRR